MSDVDTSRPTVERLAAIWEQSSWAGGGFTHTRAAATLRALLDERDLLREALKCYANPDMYKPHPHGPAFNQYDLSFIACAVLNARGKDS